MPAPRAPVDPLTGLGAARLGVYVHFPYCLSKCPYCDFASTAFKTLPEERYTRAILRELAARAPALAGRTVDSIFFGGGTPSLWAPARVGEVLEALAGALTLGEGLEVTLEANPGAADAERFGGYRAAGVNRLSIGVQSFQAQTLAALGRAHSGAEAVAAFRAARQAGFDNVSLDFIYGVHGQSAQQVEADARAAAALEPEHLSAYALTLDVESLAEAVPLARQLQRGEVTLPPDAVVVQMQRAVEAAFSGSSLQRYEVSNYAREGFHARHNALYWTGGEYLALGSGATGFLRTGPTTGERYANHRSAEKYLEALEAGALPTASLEPLEAAALLSERIAMGLRLVSGVDLAAACRAFGEDPAARLAKAAHLERNGLLTREGGRHKATARGMDLHSALAAHLM